MRESFLGMAQYVGVKIEPGFLLLLLSLFLRWGRGLASPYLVRYRNRF